MKDDKKIRISVNNLAELFCDVHNVFQNIDRKSLFLHVSEEKKSGILQNRVSDIKRKILMIFQKELKKDDLELPIGEFPFKITAKDIVKKLT